MKALVDGLYASGGTNFYGGFAEAFDLIDTSTAYEFTSNCHTAILFLTDGRNVRQDIQRPRSTISSINATRPTTPLFSPIRSVVAPTT